MPTQTNVLAAKPNQKELTIQQAAEFLTVSDSFLVAELLDTGIIPSFGNGSQRRIRYNDLMRYHNDEELEIARSTKVMEELMAETERLGLDFLPKLYTVKFIVTVQISLLPLTGG